MSACGQRWGLYRKAHYGPVHPYRVRIRNRPYYFCNSPENFQTVKLTCLNLHWRVRQFGSSVLMVSGRHRDEAGLTIDRKRKFALLLDGDAEN